MVLLGVGLGVSRRHSILAEIRQFGEVLDIVFLFKKRIECKNFRVLICTYFIYVLKYNQ